MLLSPDQIKRVTFRKEKYERWTIGDPGSSIKVNGKECGSISSNPHWGGNPTGDNLFSIRLQFGLSSIAGKTLEWTWVTLKARFKTDAEARAFLTVDTLRTALAKAKEKPKRDDGSYLTGMLWTD